MPRTLYWSWYSHKGERLLTFVHSYTPAHVCTTHKKPHLWTAAFRESEDSVLSLVSRALRGNGHREEKERVPPTPRNTDGQHQGMVGLLIWRNVTLGTKLSQNGCFANPWLAGHRTVQRL